VLSLVTADLRSRQRSSAFLALGALVLMLALAGSFTAYGGAEQLGSAFGGDKTPALFSALTGTEGAEIFSARGFLSFGFVHPLLLLLVLVPVVSTGVAAAAGDIDSRRAELLFACPVRRTLFYDAKLLSCAVVGLGVVSGAVVGAEVGRLLSEDMRSLSPWAPVVVGLQLLPLLVFFAGATFALSALSRTHAAAQGRAVAVVAGSYLLNVLALLWSPLSWASRLDPFHWYQPLAPVGGRTWAGGAGLVAGGVLLLLWGREKLLRRDAA
jgi:hypothetical protein